MKTIRIFLLVLIVVGIGLLITKKLWVPKLVDYILKSENGTLVTTNETNGWETYVDMRKRFAIKYPTNWHYLENNKQDYVAFCSDEDKECNINVVYVYVYTKGGSKEILNNFRKQGSGYKEKIIIFDNKTAIQRKESYCNGTPRLTNGLFIEGSNNDYQIQGPYSKCGIASESVGINYDELLKVFYQMIYTFKTD